MVSLVLAVIGQAGSIGHLIGVGPQLVVPATIADKQLREGSHPDKNTCVRHLKVARNEVENASFAQLSAHRDSRIWRPELIEPAAERK